MYSKIDIPEGVLTVKDFENWILCNENYGGSIVTVNDESQVNTFHKYSIGYRLIEGKKYGFGNGNFNAGILRSPIASIFKNVSNNFRNYVIVTK